MIGAQSLEHCAGGYVRARIGKRFVDPLAHPVLKSSLLSIERAHGGSHHFASRRVGAGFHPSVDTFALGDDVDWYRGSETAFVELAQWGHIRTVGNAYANSGDPKYAEATVTCGCGNKFVTRSTRKNITVEICSACHPFFTGKMKFIDTTGRMERFQKKYNWDKRKKAGEETASK